MSSDKDIAIRVENLSKMYRLGTIGTGTLSHDLNVYWHKLRGKGNPYAQVGEENNREQLGESDYVWALRDINFEVKKGEIMGIIGKNGAGKSTLLKILSRITGPTDGSIKVNGRMASLLEVGTGFHPELTGRENIYLNGAIMGMTKQEITSKLDEIIDFSGCTRYIDTPVKRYSSGMTVRLGFAVAAFLEPEILIVDEVLAVGDAEFQKKAIGKMQEVSKGEGRTVLFVSHNMAAIQNLCSKGLYMDNGMIKINDDIDKTIMAYRRITTHEKIPLSLSKNRKGNGNLFFTHGEVKPAIGNLIETFQDLIIELKYEIKSTIEVRHFKVDVGINNILGDRVAWLSTDLSSFERNGNKVLFHIEKFPLAPGDYNLNIYCEINNDIADWLSDVVPFSIIEKDYYGSGKIVPSNQGNILLNYKTL